MRRIKGGGRFVGAVQTEIGYGERHKYMNDNFWFRRHNIKRVPTLYNVHPR